MDEHRWTAERAWAWVQGREPVRGCNYVPSTAVNTTEMWQADSFDPETIARELGWAAQVGLNSCRVFVQYLVWQDDPHGLRQRLDHFLCLADDHGLTTMFVLFDDCAFSGKLPYLGPQAAPVPGVHNSGWTPSPGRERVTGRSHWPSLEAYVQDIIGHFAQDHRVIAWDLYNEPGNSEMGTRSQPLLEASFDWAHAVQPAQPLTVGVWNAALAGPEQVCLDHSDVISFHTYSDLATTRRRIEQLAALGRPLLCTEWMSRVLASRFATHLPLFRAQHVGWYMWGLVNGKTQTHMPWGSQPGAPEPVRWHHDIIRRDGSYYCQAEIDLLRQYAAAPER
jgi:hypothetical protein